MERGCLISVLEAKICSLPDKIVSEVLGHKIDSPVEAAPALVHPVPDAGGVGELALAQPHGHDVEILLSLRVAGHPAAPHCAQPAKSL